MIIHIIQSLQQYREFIEMAADGEGPDVAQAKITPLSPSFYSDDSWDPLMEMHPFQYNDIKLEEDTRHPQDMITIDCSSFQRLWWSCSTLQK